MTSVIRVLFNLWSLPVAIPIWFYLWLCLWRGWYTRDPSTPNVLLYHGRGPWWLRRLWKPFKGCALPGAVVVRYEWRKNSGTLHHERRHVLQWYVLGPLFPVVYILFLIAFGYRDHPLEIDARVHESTVWERQWGAQ